MLEKLSHCMDTNPKETKKCEELLYDYRSKYLFTNKVEKETQKIIDYMENM